MILASLIVVPLGQLFVDFNLAKIVGGVLEDAFFVAITLFIVRSKSREATFHLLQSLVCCYVMRFGCYVAG